ncbi:sedoheptulose 7-phosphate cyclase [Streptomyces sp. NPDC002209]|uniref:sedoheptulose 7-phosphate cyclase n=1 Tax=Streptomyces sp. NPDC002209 TaxID=3364638 RepID=UPI00367AB7A1
MAFEDSLADLPHMVTTTRDPASATSPYFDNHGVIETNITDRAFSVTATLTVQSAVQMADGVFDPGHELLSELYKPLGRCIAVVDEDVDRVHGPHIRGYFAAHGIDLNLLVCRARERDKNLGTVSRIVDFLGTNGCDVSRREPVLVIGGGVLSDTAGLACALLHRRTPYVMVGTSIVSAIDAGPSPRTCVNADGFKNFLGAYHPPVLTVVDRTLLATLDARYLRHGVAEMVKMAVVDDAELFRLLEHAGPNLVSTGFSPPADSEPDVGGQILYRSLYAYMKHEGTNMFEAYQDRPHAYGHTWSPTFEPRARLLHGHAVAIEMCFSAAIALQLGWISKDDRARIVRLCTSLGLAANHPVIHDIDLLLQAQESMRAKRGGRALWAPLPRKAIGSCDYLSEAPASLLKSAVAEHATFCRQLPDNGAGTQVGLPDEPSDT